MFDKRIKFSMELYNESVKALDFPKTKDSKIDFDEISENEQDEADLMADLMDEFDDDM